MSKNAHPLRSSHPQNVLYLAYPILRELIRCAARLLLVSRRKETLIPPQVESEELQPVSVGKQVFQGFATLNKLRREAAGAWSEMDILRAI